MKTWMRVSAGLTTGLLLWTGTALAQQAPAGADKSKTPDRIEGQVVKIDHNQGKVTIRASDGTTHEFQASAETLKDLKVGDRIEAALRK
jgi:ribosomal protein S1